MDDALGFIIALVAAAAIFSVAVLALCVAAVIGALWCIVRVCAIFRGHGLDAAGTAGGL